MINGLLSGEKKFLETSQFSSQLSLVHHFLKNQGNSYWLRIKKNFSHQTSRNAIKQPLCGGDPSGEWLPPMNMKTRVQVWMKVCSDVRQSFPTLRSLAPIRALWTYPPGSPPSWKTQHVQLSSSSEGRWFFRGQHGDFAASDT